MVVEDVLIKGLVAIDVVREVIKSTEKSNIPS
jgi:hypothetical protein